MILNMQCEKCGSPVLFDNFREYMFCWHCGKKIFNPGTVAAPAQQLAVPAPAPGPAQLTPVQMVPLNVMSAPVQNYYNGPNLIVSYDVRFLKIFVRGKGGVLSSYTEPLSSYKRKTSLAFDCQARSGFIIQIITITIVDQQLREPYLPHCLRTS